MRLVADYIFKAMTYLVVLSGVVYVFGYMHRVSPNDLAKGVSMFGLVMSVLTVFYLMLDDTDIYKKNSGPIYLRVIRFMMFLYFVLCWYFFVEVPVIQAFSLPTR
jgi:hypothetical protein